jgi:protein phosphatase
MPNGEQASALVVRELAALDPGGSMARALNADTDTTRVVPSPAEIPTAPLIDSADPLAALRAAVERANREIRALIEADDDTEGMGTTVTALLLAGDKAAMLHVGDSRGYLLHDGVLEQVTRDDTYVQTLVDQGLLSAMDAKIHPRRSVVMQAVQGLAYDPTCTVRSANPGDRYLLCSDGLSDVVGDEALKEALELEPDATRCAQMLVRLALQGGGPDNVTVIVADVATT